MKRLFALLLLGLMVCSCVPAHAMDVGGEPDQVVMSEANSEIDLQVENRFVPLFAEADEAFNLQYADEICLLLQEGQYLNADLIPLLKLNHPQPDYRYCKRWQRRQAAKNLRIHAPPL